MVKEAANKFLGIFLLQGISLIAQNLLMRFFVYKNATSIYGDLVFEFSLNVFPILDLVIPCGFIVYTHYKNFTADHDHINQQYHHYSESFLAAEPEEAHDLKELRLGIERNEKEKTRLKLYT